MDISVIYLCYVPLGTSFLKCFIDSYKKHNSGKSHNLTILFNGVKEYNDLKQFIDILDNSEIIYDIKISPKKFDIDSYFYISKLVKTEFLCFLNTYSVIKSDNWLFKLHFPFEDSKIGVTGATGGYGDKNHDEEFKLILKNFKNLDIFKLKKIIYYRFNYYPKILPHIRTNAFLIKTKVFNNLKYYNVRPFFLNFIFKLSQTKLKSLIFEHGNHSLTNQLLKIDLKPVIVDSKGNIFEIKDWTKSKTFWLYDQENLLITDNQTNKYEFADSNTKKNMQITAWGSQINF